jgi:hypothetical protein
MPDIRWSEAASTPSSSGRAKIDADPEDELWNLLDVIHRKGVRLRKEASELSAGVSAADKGSQAVLAPEPEVSVENIITELESLRAERDRLRDEVLELKRENISSKSQIHSLQDQVHKVRLHFLSFTVLPYLGLPYDHLLLDRSPNIGPLISRWELDKFENC